MFKYANARPDDPVGQVQMGTSCNKTTARIKTRRIGP